MLRRARFLSLSCLIVLLCLDELQLAEAPFKSGDGSACSNEKFDGDFHVGRGFSVFSHQHEKVCSRWWDFFLSQHVLEIIHLPHKLFSGEIPSVFVAQVLGRFLNFFLRSLDQFGRPRKIPNRLLIRDTCRPIVKTGRKIPCPKLCKILHNFLTVLVILRMSI